VSISDGEKQLLSHLDKLFNEGAEARNKASQGWDRAIKTIKGNVWPERRPKYKVDAVMNFLSTILERKAALLTDSRPAISVVSRKTKPTDDPLCEILQKTIEGILDEKNFEQRLTEFVMLEQMFGFALFNTTWDRNLDYGNGDVDIVVIDPRCFIFDPFVTRSWNLQFGEYCCLETVKPTQLLQDMNGKRADDIKSDFGSGDVKQDSLLYKLHQLFKFDKTDGATKTSVIKRSIVRDWWIKDRVTKDKGSLMFPTWRHLIVAGGTIIEDGTNPYIDGNHPFDGMEWGFNVDSAYGRNEVDILESPQIMFNKVMATILENAILMGNGIWKGDRDALSDEDWKRLTNEPGSHVKTRPGKQLTRETPPALPNYMMATLTMLMQGIEKLSGITEVTEGRKPGQVTSGVAIESLAVMAQTTIRLKARQIENVIQRVGQKLIPRIFAYYTTDRVFNQIGMDGKVKTYLFEREKIRNAIQKGGMKVFQDYIFKVVPTSSLAMTKWQKGMMATQLFQLGLIDAEAALDALEYTNREEIMERMAEKEKQQMEIMKQMGVEEGGDGKGGFGQKKQPAKVPKNLLGRPHRETGLQEPTGA
jgi:hypothetical protein